MIKKLAASIAFLLLVPILACAQPLADKLPAGAMIYIGWYGLDQGVLMMMIENYRSRMVWDLMRRSGPIAEGLRRAGFSGGWLSTATLVGSGH